MVLVELGDAFGWGLLDNLSGRMFYGLLALWALICWALATPLLIAFCHRGTRGSRESTLSRAGSTLFLRTVVDSLEPLAGLPRLTTLALSHGSYLMTEVPASSPFRRETGTRTAS